jgi:hypothetical protein
MLNYLLPKLEGYIEIVEHLVQPVSYDEEGLRLPAMYEIKYLRKMSKYLARISLFWLVIRFISQIVGMKVNVLHHSTDLSHQGVHVTINH